MSEPAELTADQRRIVLTAWGTYACYYLGRLNLSVAIPALVIALNVSRAQVGVLGTVFYWTYGLGTLVFGELGNIFRPRLLVALGLLTITLANLGFSAQTALLPMAILWGINGFAQSTGWSPLLRVLSDHLSAPQRTRVAALFPINFQLGAIVTWTVTGLLVASVGWQSVFWVPGLALILPLAYWWRSGIDGRAVPSAHFSRHDTLADLRRFAPVLLSNAISGFVLVGTVIWTPTYVIDTGYVSESAAGLVSAALPIAGLIGILLSNSLLQRRGRAESATLRLLAGSLAASLLAVILPLPFQAVALLIVLVSVNGAAGLLTSALPLQVAKSGRASSTIGLMNGAYNLGGGFAGVIVGAVLEASDWPLVFLMWSVVLAASILLLWRFTRRS